MRLPRFSAIEPGSALSDQSKGGFRHFRAGQTVLLVQFLGQICGLPEFAGNAQGHDSVWLSRLGEGMAQLSPHAANDLVVFNGHQSSPGSPQSGTDGLDIGTIYEGGVDHGR